MTRCSSWPAGVRRGTPSRDCRSCGARQLRALEPAKTIHQQRARDARQPAIEIVEVPNAREQLANDQRRPAIGEDLGGARDGASTLRPADLVR